MRDGDREDKWMKRVAAIGEFLEAVGTGQGTKGLEGGRVLRVTIRYPTAVKPEALLVVKATSIDGDQVGFVGGLDVGTAILTWRAKDSATGLRWREDTPWVPTR